MRVVHVLTLSGIGGVQKNFSDYYKSLSRKEKSAHLILSIRSPDKEYGLDYTLFHFLKSIVYLAASRFSNKVIIHSYNNAGSKKYYLLFKFLKPKNLVFHERGNAWNLKGKAIYYYKKNVSLSKVVLCNSIATRTYLEKSFNLTAKKLVHIYNGTLVTNKLKKKGKRSSQHFIIGYLGRLEPLKGAHLLCKSLEFLDPDQFIIKIAGDGTSLSELKGNYPGIEFLGRISRVESFLNEIDLLVIPSIREPLGMVAIEAGLSRTPCLASRVDGLPEIIEDEVTGFLITPDCELSSATLAAKSSNSTLPDAVVDIQHNRLIPPKEICPQKLAEKIKHLSLRQKELKESARKLNHKVNELFSMGHYKKNITKVYQNLINQ